MNIDEKIISNINLSDKSRILTFNGVAKDAIGGTLETISPIILFNLVVVLYLLIFSFNIK